MDTQDAQKTSNRAHKKTLKQKKQKTGSGPHFGIRSKYGTSAVLQKSLFYIHTLNFTILQTTKYDLVNSLHTSGFLNRQSMKSFLSTC